MTTLPEEAVKAPERIRVAQDAEGFWTCREAVSGSTEYVRADLALPHLPGVGVKKLEWTKGVVDIAYPHPGMKYVACSTTPKGSWAFWLDHAPETRSVFTSEEDAKAAAQADYEARILSAIETVIPVSQSSAALELALEALKAAEQFIENGFEFGFIRKPDKGDTALETLPKIKAAIHDLQSTTAEARIPVIDEGFRKGLEAACEVIDAHSEYDRQMRCDGRECGCYGATVHQSMQHYIRALSSPDHADAGKVEGDGWKPIESAPKDGTVIQAWHQVHKCPVSVLWKDGGFPYGGERLNWYERSYTTAWPERAFSHWRHLPSAPSQEVAGS
ncbi:hypothetical protein [Brucella intermedia]|uniref:hypothetical protein n=1 Tax=Brucella intermedia TaxID=94625 RepID=UPI00158EC1AE|nr:hypothetical protein [Brucella intermedia]